ncbi:hypothetical protein LguiB_035479 [Lonicera macranthoides]
MKLFLILLLIHFSTYAHSSTDISVGYKVTLAVPMAYNSEFTGSAFLMETNQMIPNFRTALSVESFDEKYACSLNVFLGDVKVWSSGHFSRFFTMEECVLELTQEGDLQLKGEKDQIGWRTGTSGQGVKRLGLLRTGNLVLVDELNLIKWQSFNFPTDTMLWGHRLDVETRLTSFLTNSTSFYSFEIQRDKIALYLNSGKWKYSYWEFKPSKNRNITFAGLATYGLEIFDDKHKKIAQILSRKGPQPLRFLALGNKTGNLGLYFYSPEKGKFEASFQVLNTTCDLPLACKPYGICTFSNSCSCIRLVKGDEGSSSDCSKGVLRSFCGGKQVEMLELEGVTSVLKGDNRRSNISRKDCASLCIDNCECVAALYNDDSEIRECSLYGEVRGVRQIDKGRGVIYMVKVMKGSGHGKSSGLKKWVIVVVGVSDGLIILAVLGGVFYYVIKRRRKQLVGNTGDNT